jgi:hypothetical protein
MPRVIPDSESRQAAEHVKQEQPQIHEDSEAQKVVDRINKKVDAQRENRSAKTRAKPPQQDDNHAAARGVS